MCGFRLGTKRGDMVQLNGCDSKQSHCPYDGVVVL